MVRTGPAQVHLKQNPSSHGQRRSCSAGTNFASPWLASALPCLHFVSECLDKWGLFKQANLQPAVPSQQKEKDEELKAPQQHQGKQNLRAKYFGVTRQLRSSVLSYLAVGNPWYCSLGGAEAAVVTVSSNSPSETCLNLRLCKSFLHHMTLNDQLSFWLVAFKFDSLIQVFCTNSQVHRPRVVLCSV